MISLNLPLKITCITPLLFMNCAFHHVKKIEYNDYGRIIKIYEENYDQVHGKSFYFLINEEIISSGKKENGLLKWNVQLNVFDDTINIDKEILDITFSKYSNFELSVLEVNYKESYPNRNSIYFASRLSDSVELMQPDIRNAIFDQSYLAHKIIKYADIFYKLNLLDMRDKTYFYNNYSLPYGESGKTLYRSSGVTVHNFFDEIDWDNNFFLSSDSTIKGHRKMYTDNDNFIVLGEGGWYREKATYYFTTKFKKLNKVEYTVGYDEDSYEKKIILQIL